jgi:hypothetical protein
MRDRTHGDPSWELILRLRDGQSFELTEGTRHGPAGGPMWHHPFWRMLPSRRSGARYARENTERGAITHFG